MALHVDICESPTRRGRGAELLLQHIAELTRAPTPTRGPTCLPNASERLSAEVGEDFARLLVRGLARGGDAEQQRVLAF
jgi:hypothetical protein